MKLVHSDKYDYSKVLYKNINSKICITCPIHGTFEQTAKQHLRGSGCKVCGRLTAKQTCLDKYGVDNPSKSTEVQTKIKATFLDNYGCHPRQTEEVKNKQKLTCLEKYGVDNPRKSTYVKEIIKKTMWKKYGVEHSSQNKDIQEKQKQTMLKNHGVEYALQHQGFRDKFKNTCFYRYGVTHSSKNPFIIDKIRQTNTTNNLGVHNTQTHMISILPLIQDYDWLVDQYINQSKTATQIAHELGITGTTICNYLRMHEIAIHYTIGYSYKAICWLDGIMQQEGIYIQHMLNNDTGEYKISGSMNYKADGYCESTNTIYEFHGDVFHGNPNVFGPDEYPNFYKPTVAAAVLYQQTKDREDYIRSEGYNLVVMWERNFDESLF